MRRFSESGAWQGCTEIGGGKFDIAKRRTRGHPSGFSDESRHEDGSTARRRNGRPIKNQGLKRYEDPITHLVELICSEQGGAGSVLHKAGYIQDSNGRTIEDALWSFAAATISKE